MKNMYVNKKTNKIIAITLSFLMIFLAGCTQNTAQDEKPEDDAVVEQVLPEDTAIEANLIKLEEFEGQIEIINADGIQVEAKEEMRLQSGFKISTSAGAYAFISLDDSKAIRLDGLSSAKVEKDEKNLLISLDAGKLFFNVTNPLETDETMNIKTSNMVTGIRGTSGYLEVYQQDNLDISLTTILTGEVAVNATDLQGQEFAENALISGQTAVYDYDDDDDHIAIFDVEQDEIPAFVKVAILNDADLQEEIKQSAEFDIDDLLDDAENEWEQEKNQQKLSDDDDDIDNDDLNENDDDDDDDNDLNENDDDDDDTDDLDDNDDIDDNNDDADDVDDDLDDNDINETDDDNDTTPDVKDDMDDDLQDDVIDTSANNDDDEEIEIEQPEIEDEDSDDEEDNQDDEEDDDDK